jgi:hypothetical protein
MSEKSCLMVSTSFEAQWSTGAEAKFICDPCIAAKVIDGLGQVFWTDVVPGITLSEINAIEKRYRGCYCFSKLRREAMMAAGKGCQKNWLKRFVIAPSGNAEPVLKFLITCSLGVLLQWIFVTKSDLMSSYYSGAFGVDQCTN